MSSLSFVLFGLGAMPRLLVAGGAATTAMEPRPCDGPWVDATAEFRERFPSLAEQLQAELRARKGLDVCALVKLRATERTTTVEVTLPDGRSAAREVERGEDVRLTLQALLLVPERAATPPPATTRPAPEKMNTAWSADLVARRERAPKERAHGFELSVVGGARVGDGQYGYGAGVLSFIEIQRWLIGFQGRADGYRAVSGSDPETALALGVLLGRRFDCGDQALDLTVGPALSLRGVTFSQTETVMAHANGDAPLPPPPERNVSPLPRLLLGARLAFSPRSLFRTFIGVDAELGPRGRAYSPERFESSGSMPAYTLGLSLGATLGTR